VTGRRPTWLAVDLLALLVFATIGRRSHAEGITVAGVLSTAWPFAVGAVVGWLVVRAWRRPVAVWPVGEGTPVDFVAVATAFLALFLLGWRAVVVLLHRRRRARSLPSARR
jgi:hypothetical protein